MEFFFGGKSLCKKAARVGRPYTHALGRSFEALQQPLQQGRDHETDDRTHAGQQGGSPHIVYIEIARYAEQGTAEGAQFGVIADVLCFHACCFRTSVRGNYTTSMMLSTLYSPLRRGYCTSFTSW
jgi:hypothetical protein